MDAQVDYVLAVYDYIREKTGARTEVCAHLTQAVMFAPSMQVSEPPPKKANTLTLPQGK